MEQRFTVIALDHKGNSVNRYLGDGGGAVVFDDLACLNCGIGILQHVGERSGELLRERLRGLARTELGDGCKVYGKIGMLFWLSITRCRGVNATVFVGRKRFFVGSKRVFEGR